MARHQPVALDATVEVTKTPATPVSGRIQRVGARRRVQLVRPAPGPLCDAACLAATRPSDQVTSNDALDLAYASLCRSSLEHEPESAAAA